MLFTVHPKQLYCCNGLDEQYLGLGYDSSSREREMRVHARDCPFLLCSAWCNLTSIRALKRHFLVIIDCSRSCFGHALVSHHHILLLPLHTSALLFTHTLPPPWTGDLRGPREQEDDVHGPAAGVRGGGPGGRRGGRPAEVRRRQLGSAGAPWQGSQWTGGARHRSQHRHRWVEVMV